MIRLVLSIQGTIDSGMWLEINTFGTQDVADEHSLAGAIEIAVRDEVVKNHGHYNLKLGHAPSLEADAERGLRYTHANVDVEHDLYYALKMVCEGNDLAAEREESLDNWRGSDARKTAMAALGLAVSAVLESSTHATPSEDGRTEACDSPEPNPHMTEQQWKTFAAYLRVLLRAGNPSCLVPIEEMNKAIDTARCCL